MAPHWPSPLVAWILLGSTAAVFVGTAVNWWLNRATRDVRAEEEDAAVFKPGGVVPPPADRVWDCNDDRIYRLPRRSGVNSMFDPGRDVKP